MRTIAFFNNKGGVGKTSLVYHLAWMYADLGLRVVAADLDPQANLTRMFLDDEQLEGLWSEMGERRTVYGALRPLLEGTGDVATPHLEEATPGLALVVGDLALSAAEDELSSQWPDCPDRKPRAFRVVSALWRVLAKAADRIEADVVLVDVGPNLGAFNRVALVSADYLAVPLAPDLHSLQGLRYLGPVLSRWREEWSGRRGRNPMSDLEIPEGTMRPIGYIVMQHPVRPDRAGPAYGRWMDRIPAAYRAAMATASRPEARSGRADPRAPGREARSSGAGPAIVDDEHCLAILKHFRGLMPLAQEARKPMFFLKPADGAIGGHASAVRDCYGDFRALARTVAGRCGVALP